MIPVLIVPVLNRPELLHAMLDSIDHPVDKVVVIDNGDVVKSLPYLEHVERAHLVKSPTNLGVPVSWNLGIRMLPFATDYHPYTSYHVSETLQILLFTAVGFFLLLKKLVPEPTISPPVAPSSASIFAASTSAFGWPSRA